MPYADPERRKQYHRDRYYANREARLAQMRQYSAEHPEVMFARRLRRHGLSLESYEALLAKQGGLCAICEQEMRPPTVDHDHSCCSGRYSCGQCVRGLLCGPCNGALGYMRDNPGLLRAAALYLGEEAALQAAILGV